MNWLFKIRVSCNGTAKGEGFGLSSTQEQVKSFIWRKSKIQIKQLTSEIVEARVMIPVQMSI